MSDIEVRLIHLEPLRVASFWGYGPQPELIAWQKLEAWAKPRGLFDVAQQQIFGFNNPNPSHGSPNYGYELWIAVGPEVLPEGDLRLLDFPGGSYAVTRCDVRPGQYEHITAAWMELVAWCENSPHTILHTQCLEKSVPPPEGCEFALDLYLPVAG